MTAPDRDRLPGTPLRPGTVRLQASDEEALVRVIGDAPDRAGLHPLWAYIAPQRGIGVGVADLCDLAGFSVDDGPMMGSIDLDMPGEILPDVDYRVEGEVVDLQRKSGRSLGSFDVLTYRERLVAPDGSVVATATNTFILPRKGDS